MIDRIIELVKANPRLYVLNSILGKIQEYDLGPEDSAKLYEFFNTFEGFPKNDNAQEIVCEIILVLGFSSSSVSREEEWLVKIHETLVELRTLKMLELGIVTEADEALLREKGSADDAKKPNRPMSYWEMQRRGK